jgi:hypothetical protein
VLDGEFLELHIARATGTHQKISIIINLVQHN